MEFRFIMKIGYISLVGFSGNMYWGLGGMGMDVLDT